MGAFMKDTCGIEDAAQRPFVRTVRGKYLDWKLLLQGRGQRSLKNGIPRIRRNPPFRKGFPLALPSSQKKR